MRVEKLVTYLEMRDVAQLRATPATGVDVLVLRDPEAHLERIKDLHDLVATPHLWSSLCRTDGEWRRILQDPRHEHLIARVDGTDAGWAFLDRGDPDSVEIVAFGLRAESVGRGLGGAFLTKVVRQAWQGDGTPAQRPARVRLHTSSWDHPRALPNYLARGFSVCGHELQEKYAGRTYRSRREVGEPPRVLVRPAVTDDAAPVNELMPALGYDRLVAVTAARLAQLSASPSDLVGVAVEGPGRVVGFVSAHLVPLFAERAEALCRITSLVVSSRRRRQGVGRRLIGLVEYWAYEGGARRVEVSSGRRPERAAAHAFFPGMGFQSADTDSIRYWKHLLPDT